VSWLFVDAPAVGPQSATVYLAAGANDNRYRLPVTFARCKAQEWEPWHVNLTRRRPACRGFRYLTKYFPHNQALERRGPGEVEGRDKGCPENMLGKVEEMSAKELKEALSEAQVDFSDCFEKADLRMRLKSHLSKLNEDMVMKKKQYANNAFARGSFALAIRFYTDALNLLEEGEESQLMSDQIHSNKSLTFLKMGQAHSALTEARSCDPSYAKGWLRIANALARLGESTKVK
jgi:hypothetical protein